MAIKSENAMKNNRQKDIIIRFQIVLTKNIFFSQSKSYNKTGILNVWAQVWMEECDRDQCVGI